ncbi:hypothetical protein [Nitrosopumilus piranensis]|uniref:CbiN domain protein n=1 Tax=Nitrosopumilus piranensis TaxID=1582439 RepID=A0A0C5BQJ4_9ARCH|nr:hypothetical protein [Nitrosopumilus piranensis]AJM91998.1 exported protein of unknown function [Nitrosopumilus piranensis]
MKTRFLILTFLVLISFGFQESYSLSCVIPNLGDVYDSSDYVFHGKVLYKNYLTLDSRMPVVTFQIQESFKGNAIEQISVTVNENWDYQFEDGFEYVVFVYREELSLMTDPCWPKFHTFHSTLDIVKKLAQSDVEIRSQTTEFVYESLLPEERKELEENQKIIQEKKLERWDEITFQKQMTVFAGILMIPVVAVMAFVYFRRNRK